MSGKEENLFQAYMYKDWKNIEEEKEKIKQIEHKNIKKWKAVNK